MLKLFGFLYTEYGPHIFKIRTPYGPDLKNQVLGPKEHNENVWLLLC